MARAMIPEIFMCLTGVVRGRNIPIYNRYWAMLLSHGRKMIIVFSINRPPNSILNLMKRSKIKERYLDSLRDLMDKEECVTDDQIRFKEFLRK